MKVKVPRSQGPPSDAFLDELFHADGESLGRVFSGFSVYLDGITPEATLSEQATKFKAL